MQRLLSTRDPAPLEVFLVIFYDFHWICNRFLEKLAKQIHVEYHLRQWRNVGYMTAGQRSLEAFIIHSLIYGRFHSTMNYLYLFIDEQFKFCEQNIYTHSRFWAKG